MNRRAKKKEWKKQTTARQADLMERVEALENLTRCMAAEQTAQRERVDDVHDELHLYQEAHAKRHTIEDERRRRQHRIRLEREMERRQKRRDAIRYGALLAGSALALVVALMLPAPEVAEPVPTVEPMVVMAEPAEGVVEAVAMNWEG